MGLFYVWVKYFTYSGGTYQRLITLVNRETADEWWRLISTTPGLHIGIVKRISPQLYVQRYDQRRDERDLYYFFNNGGSPNVQHFSERMSFTGAINNTSSNKPIAIQSTEITDHASGRWYFIRSKADPSSHWYLRTRGTCVVCGDTACDSVHASGEYRTRFCVRVRNNSEVQEDLIMIGSDEVSITAPKGHILYINDAGDLKAAVGHQGDVGLLFGDLKNRFTAYAERRVNGEVWEYIESVERGEGEVWELTN